MSDTSSSHITHWLSTVPSPETITSVGQPPCKQSRSQKRKATSLEDDNLEEMASSDMRPPVTPDRKKRRLEHGASQSSAASEAGGSNVTSRRTESVSHSSTPTGNIRNVRDALAREKMHFENDAAFDRYPAFKEMTFDVVSRERNSIMAPRSAKKIQEYQKENALANEKEYFSGIHRMVIKDERLVPGQKPKPSKAAQDEDKDDGEQIDAEFSQERDDTLQTDVEPACLAFKHSGMDKTQDQVFIEGLLPILEKNFGLLTPKPDFVFGFKIDMFPSELTPRLSNGVLQLIRVAPGIEHPFFVIEGKGSSGPIEEAENQAIRSGAALVNARRLLQQKVLGVSQTETRAPDLASWVFSCAWVPRMAEIFVNWLEFNPNGEPYYHMNLIETYMMNREGEIQAFRRAIHNILDWGLQPARKQALDELLVGIAAAEEAAKEEKRAAEEDKKAEAKRQKAAKKAGKEA